ncbi:hypothetical protein TIFTF001_018420 [Ficus carica]|uniref:SBP-type domain-containing protein n=1 Tax=Ficus carica TaxID=3494 RepID=A0AA88ADZ4_FICCA|nr:hypothetical protein TIFTF001_018420 [Ficus carica]
MEWNSKSSSLWDWENLFELETKATENRKKLQRMDCFVEVDRGISSGSLHSPGDGGGSSAGTGGSGSDLGHASSKSSISASNNSSSIGESKTSNKFTLEGFEPFPKDLRSEQESARVQQPRSSPTLEISAGSGEPLLSLKLGKRMYFKDICSDNNVKSSSLSVAAISSPTTAKRSKSTSHSNLILRCQVEGCNLDLSSAKDYHRKHRICESHSKSPRVIVGGVERRFCQQCSRFHGLSEFDEKKRSCRRRLSDHNARRRKPQPEAVRLNPARLSSLYDETQKMSLVFDQASRLYSRHTTNFTWDHSSDSSKLGHTREYLSKPAKTGAAPPGQLLLPDNEMPGSITMLYPHDSSRLTPKKSTAPEVLHSGLEESVVSSELNATQDLHRALSLLSTSSSWGSRETKTVSLDTCSPLHNTNHHNSSNMVQPITHQMPATHGTLPLTSEYWLTQQPTIDTASPRSNANANTNASATTHFQDLHLFKPPGDSGFYSYNFN